MSRFVELIQFHKPRFLLLLLPNQTLSSFVFRSAIEDEVRVEHWEWKNHGLVFDLSGLLDVGLNRLM
ncbi:hypothetical protein IGI04_012806 [Brassica rapa subsp. trilocularis]|uniref:Uncharacterized protein n=1 Tax=Brassica rapa subsp. trilocularis TaxID=1813537 RepID=A0ABQ7N721_BRACM|nr:hypothetical protein IGI04_033563 [Brassica rapa subsp. trilocularis]KAG5406687.1 hypothetical protein IGI04_012806 [Brassica rapa subsp. trilocularis]